MLVDGKFTAFTFSDEMGRQELHTVADRQTDRPVAPGLSMSVSQSVSHSNK